MFWAKRYQSLSNLRARASKPRHDSDRRASGGSSTSINNEKQSQTQGLSALNSGPAGEDPAWHGEKVIPDIRSVKPRSSILHKTKSTINLLRRKSQDLSAVLDSGVRLAEPDLPPRLSMSMIRPGSTAYETADDNWQDYIAGMLGTREITRRASGDYKVPTTIRVHDRGLYHLDPANDQSCGSSIMSTVPVHEENILDSKSPHEAVLKPESGHQTEIRSVSHLAFPDSPLCSMIEGQSAEATPPRSKANPAIARLLGMMRVMASPQTPPASAISSYTGASPLVSTPPFVQEASSLASPGIGSPDVRQLTRRIPPKFRRESLLLATAVDADHDSSEQSGPLRPLRLFQAQVATDKKNSQHSECEGNDDSGGSINLDPAFRNNGEVYPESGHGERIQELAGTSRSSLTSCSTSTVRPACRPELHIARHPSRTWVPKKTLPDIIE